MAIFQLEHLKKIGGAPQFVKNYTQKCLFFAKWTLKTKFNGEWGGGGTLTTYCSCELLGRFPHYFTKYQIQYVGVVYLWKLVMNALPNFMCEAKTQIQSKIIDGFSI